MTGALYFGPHGAASTRAAASMHQRDPLLSFKTVLGASNVQEALRTKLRPSMDPTGTFINRDALVLYLAYLDQLIREAIDLAPNIPRGVAMRSAATRARSGNPAAATTRCSRRSSTKPPPCRSASASSSTRRAKASPSRSARTRSIAPPPSLATAMLETGIFEPHAAAATPRSPSPACRRASCWCSTWAPAPSTSPRSISTKAPIRRALTEIKEARQCSALAGDEIDRILIELYIRKRGGEKSREDELRLLRTARLSAREMKKELFTTGKTSLKTGGWMATTIRINELMEDQSFRTYLTALRNTMAASLNIVLQRAEAAGANVVDVVLAGGGSNLPFMGDLVRSASQVRQHNITVRAGPLSPANPLYNSVDVALRDVFPQISMSVGGALVEMMPAR
jgi:hypothetical protein